MAGRPIDWNAVVVGAWNTAILTPAGIQQRMFKLEAGIPVEVQVALDVPAPYRVRYNGIEVVAARDKLVVGPEQCSDDRLAQAAELAARAVTDLRETPLRAAGVNMRYVFDPLPEGLLALLRPQLDDALIDGGDYTLKERVTRRTLQLDSGVLNLEVVENDEAGGLVGLNFHLASSQPEAIAAWLRDAQVFTRQRDRLLVDTLHLELEHGGRHDERD